MAATQSIALPDRRPYLSKLRDYYTLTKPEVNLLILMTTSAGYYLASRGPFQYLGLINTLLGTLLVASGTATLNQWMERRWDGEMRRTASRPLYLPDASAPAPRCCLAWCSALQVAFTWRWRSTCFPLPWRSRPCSLIYWCTRRSRERPLCTMLGAIPGAMPTLIGWAGASGAIDTRAWGLFAVLFLWQFPHFLAIALMYRDDYSRAGYRMLPSFDLDSRFTTAEIVFFTVALMVTTMLPWMGSVTVAYAIAMALAGLFLLYHAAKLTKSASKALASRLLHASVIYLPIVLAIMMFGKAA